MAYDEDLAGRIREQLDPVGLFTEKAMFGGLAFLHEGNMTVCASRTGGLMVRLDPEEAAGLVSPPAVDRMVMAGRRQRSWLLVAADEIADDDALATWVERAVDFVQTLPPKA